MLQTVLIAPLLLLRNMAMWMASAFLEGRVKAPVEAEQVGKVVGMQGRDVLQRVWFL
jgi:hypothetical protein